MTFTYDLSAADNLTKMRFWIGDTEESLAVFQDEELLFILNDPDGANGNWKEAVLDAIRGIIVQLQSDPDFTADWLTVKTSEAIKNWRATLLDLADKWDLTVSGKATFIQVYRVDSEQTANFDYTVMNGLSGYAVSREWEA